MYDEDNTLLNPFGNEQLEGFRAMQDALSGTISHVASFNEQLSKIGETAAKTSEKTVKSIEKISSANKAAMKEQKAVLVDFMKGMGEQHKAVADNANSMFSLHQKALGQSVEKTNQAVKNSSDKVKQELKATELTFNRMFSALAVKATHTQGLFDKLEKTGKAVSSHSTIASKSGEHPFLEHLESVNKLQGFSSQEILGQVTKRAGANLASGSLGQVSAALAEIVPAVTELVPQVAVLGSALGFLTAIVKAMWDLDEATSKLSASFGGDKLRAENVVAHFDSMTTSLHMSREEILSLAEAMEQNGVKAFDSTNAQMDEYLKLGSDLNRVVGVTNEQFAEVAASQIAAGQSASETRTIYDGMYESMQKLGLTLRDMGDALKEGEQLWRSYGATSAASVDNMQKDVQNVMGLYKAFNIDVKEVGSSLSALAGDPKKQNREAIFVAQQLHMSASEAKLMEMMAPEKFQEAMLKSQLQASLTDTGAHWNMRRDDMAKSLSKGEQESAFEHRLHGFHNISTISGGNEHVYEQLMNDYGAWASQSKNQGRSIDEFMTDRKNGMLSDHPIGNLEKATNAMNSSWNEEAAQIGRSINQTVTHIAGGLDKLLERWGIAFNGVDRTREPGGVNYKEPPPTKAQVAARLNGLWAHQLLGPGDHADLTNTPAQVAQGHFDIGGGNWLSPEAGAAFKRAEAAAAKDGVNIRVNSAGRDIEKQKWLYDHRGTLGISPTVAKPGHSNHQSGNAVDVENFLTSRKYLEANGFVWGDGHGMIANDKWHYKYVGNGSSPTATASLVPGTAVASGVVPGPPGGQVVVGQVKASKIASPGSGSLLVPPPPPAGPSLIEGLSPEQLAMARANQNMPAPPPPPPPLDKEHREHLKRQTAALETISDHTKELKETQKAAMVQGATGTLIANQQYYLQGRQ